MPGARVASGERVTLRTAEAEDIPFLQRAGANPELRYSLGHKVKNQGQYEISANRTGPDILIVCLENEEPADGADGVTRIGQIAVMDGHYKRPELGYWLVPEVHGEGYGNESVSLVIDYVFRSYNTPAIGAQAFDFNEASRGLLESLGFTEEGRKRQYMFVDGAHRDMVQYGLLREEWDGA
ncbi:GNAT family protein [Haladaptatus sp. DJG-WS-42]|uniref:GNAT family N-acetyltransferase n=1 Tax=Haladaptatus sp. DJG-WS-42 TaxID=3120516 RepID=UPI0030CFDB81